MVLQLDVEVIKLERACTLSGDDASAVSETHNGYQQPMKIESVSGDKYRSACGV